VRQLITRLGRVRTVVVVTLVSVVLANVVSLVLDGALERGFDAHGVYLTVVIASLAAIVVAPASSWYIIGLLVRVGALEEDMRRQASYDSLTQLYNRGHFVELAERELSRSTRYSHVVSVIMLDLDEFKHINDTRGHAAGDEVLRSVGDRMRSCLREIDIAGRVGGEEFAIVLPETHIAAATAVAGRIIREIGGRPYEGGAEDLRVTASAGVAETGADNESALSSLDTLLQHADRALYEAKREGRDRVRAYSAK